MEGPLWANATVASSNNRPQIEIGLCNSESAAEQRQNTLRAVDRMPGGKARFVVQSIGLCVLRRGPRAELQGEFAPVPLKQADFTAKMANVKCPQSISFGSGEPQIEAGLQVAEIPCAPQSLRLGIVKVAIPTTPRKPSEFRLGLDCLSSSRPQSTRSRLPEEQFPQGTQHPLRQGQVIRDSAGERS